MCIFFCWVCLSAAQSDMKIWRFDKYAVKEGETWCYLIFVFSSQKNFECKCEVNVRRACAASEWMEEGRIFESDSIWFITGKTYDAPQAVAFIPIYYDIEHQLIATVECVPTVLLLCMALSWVNPANNFIFTTKCNILIDLKFPFVGCHSSEAICHVPAFDVRVRQICIVQLLFS